MIISEGKILLIHRFFERREYYVIPGGGSEQGESPEETAVREAKEETGLAVTLSRKLWEFTNEKDGRLHIYFLTNNFSGAVRLGGPEAVKNSASDSYILEWHDLSEIPTLPLVPDLMKKKLIEHFCRDDLSHPRD